MKNTRQRIKINSLFEKPNKRVSKATFTFIDLFAGIGGIRIAFEDSEGECVFSSEWDIPCQKTYSANFGDIPAGDITKIKSKEIPSFDVLTAGFPCQPFSSIGKRQGFLHATQGTLFYEIARIIKDKRPKAFLLENVKGLTTHNGGKTFKTIIGVLDKLNYKVFYKVLDSSNFEVPQVRKRIYIVGFDKQVFGDKPAFSFPKGSNKKVYINKFIEKGLTGYSVSKHLQEVYLYKVDDGRPQIIDENSKVQVKTLVSTYHKIQRLTGTFVRDGETGIRLLSQNECKAIMGFDSDFMVPVSRTQMYRQFGNSVVIPVVRAIAKEMVKTIKKEVK